MEIIKTTNEANVEEIIENLNNRGGTSFEETDRIVTEIIETVKRQKDEALRAYTEQFDGVRLEQLQVTEEEFHEALQLVDPQFLDSLSKAVENIRTYHEKQVEQSWLTHKGDGIMLGQLIRPLQRVGIYIPGGKAVYPSTVLMNAIPAQVAGVEQIAMVTPPDQNGRVNPYTLAAAKTVGISEVYKIGGAQSIAALAYGTETIAPVNKIVGPGNIFVARAKKAVFGKVDIDMIAGPSEICVLADEKANPRFIAADLLSQAEHDELASATLVTNDEALAKAVSTEVTIQMQRLERKSIMEKSIKEFGRIFVTETIEEAFDIVNDIAPEHLQIMINKEFEALPKVKNAGAIFLGSFSPEPLGDYFAGPNHTLPTNGTAKFSSPLGTYDFLKRSSLIYYNEEELRKVQHDITAIANNEGLTAHANAINIRFENKE
ncbi:histidinol dehydrogenase [Salirhabdus salicampi]|uniref:histidinol dehydrogenase n=1 Tax=Salirhabdus salicampi TaxID=476102 RepID=UPI003F596259